MVGTKFIIWYSHQIKVRPLLTHSITYTGLFGFSKYLQTQSKGQPIEGRQIVQNAIFGGFCQGPLITAWFLKLDDKFPAKNFTTISKKVFYTQIGITPILSVLYIVWNGYFENKQNLWEMLVDKFPVAYFGGLSFWTPIIVINFLLIPPLYRVTFNLFAAFIWINVLCFIGSYNKEFRMLESFKKVVKLVGD